MPVGSKCPCHVPLCQVCPSSNAKSWSLGYHHVRVTWVTCLPFCRSMVCGVANLKRRVGIPWWMTGQHSVILSDGQFSDSLNFKGTLGGGRSCDACRGQ